MSASREVQFVHNPDMPTPPEADAECLALLGELRGPSAVKELDQAVAVLDDALAGYVASVRRGDDPPRMLRYALDAAARRRTYIGRAAALRRVLKLKVVEHAGREVPDMIRVLASVDNGDHFGVLAASMSKLEAERDKAEAELASLKALAADRYSEAGFRGSYHGYRREQLSRLAGQVRALLADVRHDPHLARTLPEPEQLANDGVALVREIARLSGPGEAPRAWPQDGLLLKLSAALARRRDAEGRLAALGRDRAGAAAVVARLVGQAVAAAGGRDAVVSNVVVAQVLAGRFPAELAERSGRLKALTAAVAEFGTAWSRLMETVGDHLNGPAADHLRARRAEAEESLSTARAEMAARQTDLAGGLVDQALAGDEPARRRIEELASLAAEAFPAGFGPAIAAARFDLAAAAELVESTQAA